MLTAAELAAARVGAARDAKDIIKTGDVPSLRWLASDDALAGLRAFLVAYTAERAGGTPNWHKNPPATNRRFVSNKSTL